MNCMKCGREIPLGQVFCKDCLTDMEAYPVKPGTPVQLPVQKPVPASRRSSHTRKPRKPEEQIARLRRAVTGLSLSLISLILAFGITVAVLLHQIDQAADATLPGQNYSTDGANITTD